MREKDSLFLVSVPVAEQDVVKVLIRLNSLGIGEKIMKHYSIKAIDIFISEIASKKGWHQGDAVIYEVNNCAWESLVELQPKANQQAYYELQGKQIFQRGDQEKMLKDQMITLIALQAHIYRYQQGNRAISWV